MPAAKKNTEEPDLLTVNFSGEAYAVLKHLSYRTGKPIEDVVEQAVSVQKWYRQSVVAKGEHLAVRDGGEVRDVTVDFNEVAQKSPVQSLSSVENCVTQGLYSMKISGAAYKDLEELSYHYKAPMQDVLLQAIGFLRWYHDDVVANGKTLAVRSKENWLGISKTHDIKIS